MTENVPAGWDLTSATLHRRHRQRRGPPTPSRSTSAPARRHLHLQQLPGRHLTIVKQATPEGSTSFDFDATGTGVAADIDLVDDGAGPGDNDADFTLDSTQLGTKTVTENVPAGWI